MYADGKVDQKEIKFLAALSLKCSISSGRLKQIIETVKSGRDAPAPSGSLAEIRIMLMAMADMVLANGAVTADEKKFLRAFGESQDLKWRDVRRIISRRKSKLYNEARRTIKEAD